MSAVATAVKMWCSECCGQCEVYETPTMRRCLSCGSGRVHPLAQSPRAVLARSVALRKFVAEANAELRALGVIK